jgi:hypothetical protein
VSDVPYARLVYDHNAAVCKYVATFFPEVTVPWAPDCIGLGLMLNDELKGGVVIEMNTVFDANVTFVFENPRVCNRRLLREFMRHCFVALNLKRLTFEVLPKNKASRRFIEALGGKLEGKKRKGYDGHRNVLIYGLLPEEATFYEDA